ncbi:MAG: peptidoglycan DD-metalloendopeptidase family protein [Rhodobacteraceae bacterium]|nr:peptidoglycan DD-metalloendopeptidase family protein [Paracoccaceae bacterium]
MSVFHSLDAACARLFPERELYVRSNGAVRYLTLSSTMQVISAVAVLGVIGWATTVTLFSYVSDTELASRDQAMIEVKEAYEARVRKLQDRYSRLEAELTDSERRFDEVMRQLSGKHGQLENAAGVEVALEGRLNASRRRMSEVTEQRDDALTKLEELRLKSLEMERNLASALRTAEQRRDNLEDFVSTMEETSVERDDARRRMRSLTSEVAKLTSDIEAIRLHQSRVMAQLGEATQASLTELEGIMRQTGVDVDSLVREIENAYSGEGGPFIPLAYVSPAAATNFPVNERTVQSALEKLQRVNSLRIAIEKTPLMKPVLDSYRFTSGFGNRRHPVTGKWTRHLGIDMAAPKGTPIYATAEGVVRHAGKDGGFGNAVKIDHEFGFRTIYAHMHRVHVEAGQRVAQGDLIGEVGSTGRSTGDHLHYEIRVGKKALNPRKFIEAGRNVF